MKVKITNEEISNTLQIEKIEFDKYVSPLINLANQYAQGTRPRVVGQMSDLIQQFSGKTLTEWERWYKEQKPGAIADAAEKIYGVVQKLREAIATIDKATVERWVKDLVIVKTFLGLRFQEVILKRGANLTQTSYRLASPEEESKGIDGFIGSEPVSIKPDTYKAKDGLPEGIDVTIISYRKLKDGIEVDYSALF
ncbi:MAG: MjaI family restriction endonuclease [Candidatus Zixiibacteriota bacterium]